MNSKPEVCTSESMLFFNNCIENELILSQRYDCPESMLFFKSSIENETILSRRYDCPESMLFFKNSIENEQSSRAPEVRLSRINAFL